MGEQKTSEHILTIDDDPSMLNMYGAILKDLGHQVDRATNPDEAIFKIEQQQGKESPYTVAIIDMIYEDIGAKGKDLAKAIKAKYPYIATIISTSHSYNAQSILELRDDSGVDQFIQKKDVSLEKAYLLSSVIQRAVERVKQQIKSAQVAYQPGSFPSHYQLTHKVMTEPIFGVPSQSGQFQCDAFMIMPFRDELMPVYINGVIPAVKSRNYVIKRGDNFFSNNHIMAEVWSAIYAAKFVIADCTGQNANVFYELGMAHTLGKPTIPITQVRADIPFDIRSLRYIQYSDTPEGLIKLRFDLEQVIDSLMSNFST
jgi:CheY-like chemotaxis protein